MITATSRAERGRATRERLLDAAIERLSETGQDASFNEIASDASVTKGALYHHFRSKEKLVQEVYKEANRRHAERVIGASSSGSGRERVNGLVAESARLYGSGTPFYRLLLRLHVEAGSSRPYLADIARRVQTRQREYMTGLVLTGQQDGSIRDDVDAETLGQTINAALQGFLIQAVEPPETQRLAVVAFGELLGTLI